MIEKVLIANRGEIALRILRACKSLGIKTVAIHSLSDADAMHVKLADEAICIGNNSPAESYLNKMSILSSAEITGSSAIHPGYGFLSENAEFAEMCNDLGFAFIGPSHEHIELMGDKVNAKKTAIKLGLPVVPGSDGAVETVEEALQVAKEFGYPILIKAASGGGGRGMQVVEAEKDLAQAFAIARAEAERNFDDSTVYIEKYLKNPMHIEVQIIGDKHGNVIHLGERDCSVQRRNQKVVEEAPSIAVTQEQREYICNLSAKAMQELGYYSAGTIEYLFEDGKFYFMEMNTRIQVEHPVTEMVTGVDLIKEMIRVANGEKLSVTQDDIKLKGHAMEFRINAEDPFNNFVPNPGNVSYYHAPGGFGVRVDSNTYTGGVISPYYDSMIAKLIVHDKDRESCIKKAQVALREFIIEGLKTTLPLHEMLLKDPEFSKQSVSIKWLEAWLEKNNLVKS